jgi:hypothetical protein
MGSRELPVARDQVLPALAGLLHANATHTAQHVASHSGEPYIAEQRKLEQPILEDVLVRTADDPERLRSLAEVMVRGEDGRFQQTVPLARGGGASILIVFADWVLDTLDGPADQAGTAFVVLDTAAFLQVGSRRLLSWLAVRTTPVVDANAPLPAGVPRAPSNTVYKRIDLNHTSVQDFGRHGQDLDRVCEDIREDLCGEHGIMQIDRRIHSAHAIWSGPHPATVGVLAHRPRPRAPRRPAAPPRRPATLAQPPACSASDRTPAAPWGRRARRRDLAAIDKAL